MYKTATTWFSFCLYYVIIRSWIWCSYDTYRWKANQIADLGYSKFSLSYGTCIVCNVTALVGWSGVISVNNSLILQRSSWSSTSIRHYKVNTLLEMSEFTTKSCSFHFMLVVYISVSIVYIWCLYSDERLLTTWRHGWKMPDSTPALTWSLCSLGTRGVFLSPSLVAILANHTYSFSPSLPLSSFANQAKSVIMITPCIISTVCSNFQFI